jgi:hypothetical protein
VAVQLEVVQFSSRNQEADIGGQRQVKNRLRCLGHVGSGGGGEGGDPAWVENLLEFPLLSSAVSFETASMSTVNSNTNDCDDSGWFELKDGETATVGTSRSHCSAREEQQKTDIDEIG